MVVAAVGRSEMPLMGGTRGAKNEGRSPEDLLHYVKLINSCGSVFQGAGRDAGEEDFRHIRELWVCVYSLLVSQWSLVPSL